MSNPTGKGGFRKGQSGCPGGRPKKDNELVKLAKAKTPEAFKRVLELLNSHEDNVSLGAAKTIFEYGFGKPRQEMDLSNSDGSFLVNLAINLKDAINKR